eukprot:scaffold28748_cov64-Phaeocystis_antarctica.AAC.2
MSSSAATRSEVAALSADAGAEVATLSSDAGLEVAATSGDVGAGPDGGRAWRGADEGTARARFCKRRRCSAPLICCADRSSRLIQVRPRLGRGQSGARAGSRAGLGPLSPSRSGHPHTEQRCARHLAACARRLATRHHEQVLVRCPSHPIGRRRSPRRVQACCRLHLELLVQLPRGGGRRRRALARPGGDPTTLVRASAEAGAADARRIRASRPAVRPHAAHGRSCRRHLAGDEVVLVDAKAEHGVARHAPDDPHRGDENDCQHDSDRQVLRRPRPEDRTHKEHEQGAGEDGEGVLVLLADHPDALVHAAVGPTQCEAGSEQRHQHGDPHAEEAEAHGDEDGDRVGELSAQQLLGAIVDQPLPAQVEVDVLCEDESGLRHASDERRKVGQVLAVAHKEHQLLLSDVQHAHAEVRLQVGLVGMQHCAARRGTRAPQARGKFGGDHSTPRVR